MKERLRLEDDGFRNELPRRPIWGLGAATMCLEQEAPGIAIRERRNVAVQNKGPQSGQFCLVVAAWVRPVVADEDGAGGHAEQEFRPTVVVANDQAGIIR